MPWRCLKDARGQEDIRIFFMETPTGPTTPTPATPAMTPVAAPTAPAPVAPTTPAVPTTYVSFVAPITHQSTQVLLAACADLVRQQVRSVYLLFSTQGGQVAEGITIYAVLRALPFALTTHNVGSVNSIGNVVYLAGARRYASPASTFMFHGVGFAVVAGMQLEEKFLRERLDSIVADQSRLGVLLRT